VTIEKLNLAEKLALFQDHWHPRIAGELNGQQVKLVKVRGEFVWHAHADEDELFLILRGEMRMELRGRDPIVLRPGEFLIVPRGVEHRPVAGVETEILLFEPASTHHTGGVDSPLTREVLEKV